MMDRAGLAELRRQRRIVAFVAVGKVAKGGSGASPADVLERQPYTTCDAADDADGGRGAGSDSAAWAAVGIGEGWMDGSRHGNSGLDGKASWP